MIYNYLTADGTHFMSWVRPTWMFPLQSLLHANIAHVAVKGCVLVKAGKTVSFTLNDRFITSLTLFQAGRCFSQRKNHWNVLCKGKIDQCTTYRYFFQSMLRLFMTFGNYSKCCCAMQNFASLRSQQHSEQILLARQSSLSFTSRNLLRLEKF